MVCFSASHRLGAVEQQVEVLGNALPVRGRAAVG
jgi:hypothetical protein